MLYKYPIEQKKTAQETTIGNRRYDTVTGDELPPIPYLNINTAKVSSTAAAPKKTAVKLLQRQLRTQRQQTAAQQHCRMFMSKNCVNSVLHWKTVTTAGEICLGRTMIRRDLWHSRTTTPRSETCILHICRESKIFRSRLQCGVQAVKLKASEATTEPVTKITVQSRK